MVLCYFSMLRHFIAVTGVLALAAIMTSCGQPGAPQPPSLEMPRAVTDLSVTRKGDRVAMRWTSPARFTDGRIIKKVGKTNICRTPGNLPAVKCDEIGNVPTELPKASGPIEQSHFEDKLTQVTLGTVMYGVEVQNAYGKSVGLSNQVEISTAPALAAPSRVNATVGENGVTILWAPIAAPALPEVRFGYQISRRGESGQFAAIATVPIGDTSYVDQTFEWEKKFEYRIDVVTESASDNRVLVEGEDSETASVLAHDVFPPAVPKELQAVFSGPGQKVFIDLTWAPNLEPDLAGYFVYRREEGGTFTKLNSAALTVPSFRDDQVQAGKTYIYSVSAVDVRGNESAKSAETSESVP
ncbi:Fibronectin, type III [Candidatus Koribacter versatilis Ellin345]|uniref:Fibronectin, type III n=2 Tax=Candidatus Korobacter versatilis TaxID=658062 RepID=Q1IV99_KORVE|nr:Fibronectin, type III [Candidatus Koribacter versatilis Ellin345]